jgi:hypothetical protein
MSAPQDLSGQVEIRELVWAMLPRFASRERRSLP